MSRITGTSIYAILNLRSFNEESRFSLEPRLCLRCATNWILILRLTLSSFPRKPPGKAEFNNL